MNNKLNKKDFVLKMLDVLIDTWPLAKGLKVLIVNNAINDSVLDALISIFESAIKDIKEEKKKHKLQKSVEFINKIKKAEMESHKEDEDHIENLGKMLQDI